MAEKSLGIWLVFFSPRPLATVDAHKSLSIIYNELPLIPSTFWVFGGVYYLIIASCNEVFDLRFANKMPLRQIR